MLFLTELDVHMRKYIYCLYGPKSWLIRVYCIPTQIKQYKMKLYCVGVFFTVLVSLRS